MPPRVLVVGLDCAPPSLVFDRYRDALPNLSALMARGTWGKLRSTIPPITVPAWTSMVSGRDPGELGLYGFRNRRKGSYGLVTATSRDVRVKRLWDYVSEAGRQAIALFVPLTSPPTSLRGQMVSCFLSDRDAAWAYPRSLEARIEEEFGPYLADVEDFRADDPSRILRELHRMADQHFDIANALWQRERPDFLMMVEMGPDRLHHALYHAIDPSHPRYLPNHPYEAAAKAYYGALDARIGELVAHAGKETAVLIVSDHGARPMLGGVRINEWLRRAGYLTLAHSPAETRPFSETGVDWSRTRAFSEGGYYARIFLNVRGREPEGTIAPERYDEERDRLADALEAMPGPDGGPFSVRVVRPEQVFRKVRGLAPDLMVFFDDLAYRSIGTVGPGPLFTEANDRGPDSCNHDWDGIFILAGGRAEAQGEVEGLAIYDVPRTVLGLLGLEAPDDLLGQNRSRP